ncbi:hypothetical protein TrVE_jg771 [Triparma verrucosa]|uniref:Methyltransferase domain-containing protein n=1 Tax=Triparma verrucosa TaxID=1606542 RepID=A0A9W7FC01_9STRA|nr:hypothetical protein TrVE_jg771 [Triparma verrucosa]
MKFIPSLLPLLLLLSPQSISSTSPDIHHVDGSELDPQEILTRHPRLLEIMNKVGSSILPVPLIIREYPEVWLELQSDEEVWNWFKKHMPHFTKERARVDSNLLSEVAPRTEKDGHNDMFKIIDQVMREEYDNDEEAYLKVYVSYQNAKWSLKNHLRAVGMSSTVQTHDQRAWESHSLDKDYPGFFSRAGIQEGARVLDIGTEMGLQAVAIAKLGHKVTGTDVGISELLVATEYATREGVEVHYLQDDILVGESSHLTNHSYDVVIDRAVFHSMAPYLEEEPLIKESISKRFGERIKSLLKPSGIFIFKGMSADEDNFRPNKDNDKSQNMFEINVVAVYRAIKHVIEVKLNSDKKGYFKNKMDIAQRLGVDMDDEREVIDFLDYVAKNELNIPNGVSVDLSKNPMPYHFRSDEIPHYFQDIMGFEIVEAGKSLLYNDRKSEEYMPKAEYAVLKVHPDDSSAGTCAIVGGKTTCVAEPSENPVDLHKQIEAIEKELGRSKGSRDVQGTSEKVKGKNSKISWYEAIMSYLG